MTNQGPESSVNGMSSGPYAGSITASRFGGVRVVTTSRFHFPDLEDSVVARESTSGLELTTCSDDNMHRRSIQYTIL